LELSKDDRLHSQSAVPLGHQLLVVRRRRRPECVFPGCMRCGHLLPSSTSTCTIFTASRTGPRPPRTNNGPHGGPDSPLSTQTNCSEIFNHRRNRKQMCTFLCRRCRNTFRHRTCKRIGGQKKWDCRSLGSNLRRAHPPRTKKMPSGSTKDDKLACEEGHPSQTDRRANVRLGGHATCNSPPRGAAFTLLAEAPAVATAHRDRGVAIQRVVVSVASEATVRARIAGVRDHVLSEHTHSPGWGSATGTSFAREIIVGQVLGHGSRGHRVGTALPAPVRLSLSAEVGTWPRQSHAHTQPESARAAPSRRRLE